MSWLIALLWSGAWAAPPPSQACNVRGWSVSRAAEGLPVRAGPSRRSRELGRLPPFVAYEGGLHSGRGPTFAILESRAGWVRIAEVSTPQIIGQGHDADLEWRESELEGWIPGEAVNFVLQTQKGFARPDAASPVIFQAADWYGPPDWSLIDCDGEWVRIAWREEAASRTGWFRGVCGAQETTCDGVRGDD